MRKPNEKIFHYVLKDSNLLSDETIFIDDLLENINMAKAVQIKTIYLSKSDLIASLSFLSNPTIYAPNKLKK